MQVTLCDKQDIPEIFRLYGLAQEFQRAKKTVVVWPDFPESLVENDIAEGRQFKILMDGKIASLFTLTFSDPEIWPGREDDKAIYIHRIATNPEFRGHNFVKIITEWTVDFAKKNGYDFVRLDTLDRNEGLIEVYTSAGFEFLGMFDVKDAHKLPEHYQMGLKVAFFEIKI